MNWGETWTIAKGLLGLGLAFMLSGLFGAASVYLNRVIISDGLGVEAAGIYMAAWTLAGYYVRFILQALAADYYPRLTAVAGNREQCNRMINEQVEVALTLALPGVMATLALAPLVIELFYSSRFAQAVLILRWQTLGVLLQVIWLPLGFVILAQAQPDVFLDGTAFQRCLRGVHVAGCETGRAGRHRCRILPALSRNVLRRPGLGPAAGGLPLVVAKPPLARDRHSRHRRCICCLLCAAAAVVFAFRRRGYTGCGHVVRGSLCSCWEKRDWRG